MPVFGKLFVVKHNGVECHEPGGPVERFQNMVSVPSCSTYKHRFAEVQVVVTATSLLQVAAASGERAIVLWGHENSAMHKASTFWMAAP